MNRVTIRRFDIVRTANVVAVLYAVAVVVFFLLLAPFVLVVGIASVDRGAGGAAVGAGAVGILLAGLVAAVFYGVIGWIMTAIVCALYNVVAGRVGGIRVEVDVEGSWPGGAPGYPYGSLPPGYGSPPAAYPGAQTPSGGWGDPPPPAPPASWGPPSR